MHQLSLLGPASQLNSESDGQLGELQHMSEAELRGDIVTAGETRSVIHAILRACSGETYSRVLWMFLLELPNELSAERQ